MYLFVSADCDFNIPLFLMQETAKHVDLSYKNAVNVAQRYYSVYVCNMIVHSCGTVTVYSEAVYESRLSWGSHDGTVGQV